MYYSLIDSLKAFENKEEFNGPYVAILDSRQWQEQIDSFGFDFNIKNVEHNLGQMTKIIFDEKSTSGTFLVPDDNKKEHFFGFVLDKKRIVFMDDDDYVKTIIGRMSQDKSLFPIHTAGFFYHFIDELNKDDIEFFGRLENELDTMEIELVNKRRASSVRIAEIRSTLRKYMIFYEQLESSIGEMTENKNGLLNQETIQYLTNYQERLNRLYDFASNIREYSQEIRELRKEMIDLRQNSINITIAVATTIFLPLNLIASWYGMNFAYMPELQWRYSYHVVTLVCVLIVIGMILFFKKKRWL